MPSKHDRYYGLGMDALVIVCSRNTNAIYGLGMDALVIVCSRNTNVIMFRAWMLYSYISYALKTRPLLWFGHGCSSYRILSKSERYHGLGMDAVASVGSPNTYDIMV